MEQKTASYSINPDHFRIDMYISYDKRVVIIAKKDNNFTEWLSLGRISNYDNYVGECINYLLRNSPLPTSTSLFWRNFEDVTEMKYDELFVFFQHLSIRQSNDSHFLMNGEQIEKDASDEFIQQQLVQIHENYCETTKLTEPISFVREQLRRAITEIRVMEQECSFPWALNKVSDHANQKFVELKNKFVFSQDEEVRKLLYELYELKAMIYNQYMTAVR